MKKIVFRVVAPSLCPNGYGWDDVKVKDCETYQDAVDYIIEDNEYKELRIDKVFLKKVNSIGSTVDE